MFVFPLQRLVRTTLSCLSVQVNAKPAHMKHDDVFLNMCEGVCVCILCPYAASIKVIAAQTFILRG